MRYFLDTEFIEDGKTIDLISIGIVSESGDAYYAVSSEADYVKANSNEWVQINVLTRLPGSFSGFGRLFEIDVHHPNVRNRADIRVSILNFISDTLTHPMDRPEFWAYYADYDWVVLCQLFGTMMDLPNGWPMFCMDLKQLAVSLGDPTLPEQGKNEHNALADAKWNLEAYKFLMNRTAAMGERPSPV